MDLEPYRRYWRQRQEAAEVASRRLVERARAELPGLAALLAEGGATSVWLIGSLAEGRFHEGSDIDLMVEGLGEREAWRAAGLGAERSGFAVDVARAEDMPARWRDYHRRHGERLR